MPAFRRSTVLSFVLALLLSAAVGAQDFVPGLGRISDIVIEGTQRVDPSTVRSYLLVREGDFFDRTRIDRSLKSLFATGLFADVAIEQEGSAVIVRVVENPVINRIAFEGNRRIDDETLETETTLRPRQIYTRTKVQSDVRRILTLYRRSGRFAATVEPKVIQLADNRVDLVFEINEGDATEIERIRFVGNSAYDDSDLRGVIRTTESAWWRFFTTDDVYDPDRLALDQELLRRFYLSEGYADFRVVSALAELSPDREDFYLVFTVDEGERYRFGTIILETTLRDLDPGPLEDELKFESGEWFNNDEIETSIDALTEAVSNLGYNFIDIRPRVVRNREAKTVDITFEINEGPRVFVERIDIEGNVRTKDEVIRREFRLVEGDAFNASKIRRSRQRLVNLDYFSQVDVDEVPGSSPDTTVVKVNVEEKSTGSISLGVGFSTTSGALASVDLRERNLLGKGQDLRVRGVLAQRDSQLSLSFTEPFFLDRELAVGFDIFRLSVDRQTESSFDETNLGFALRGAYAITESWSQSWRYSLTYTEIQDVPDTASVAIQEEEGDFLTSQITNITTYDGRDSVINPTEGFFTRLTNSVAGLGGDVRYFRTVADAGYYYSVFDGWIASVSGEGGVVWGLGQDVRLFDRFFVGGDNLRGFETAGVGPRDLRTDDSLGGEWFYTGTLQLAFPLPLPDELQFRGRIFADFGSAGGVATSDPDVVDTGTLRASVGLGVTWNSPFGPIGVDYGIPVLKESFDKTQSFRFNLGARF